MHNARSIAQSPTLNAHRTRISANKRVGVALLHHCFAVTRSLFFRCRFAILTIFAHFFRSSGTRFAVDRIRCLFTLFANTAHDDLCAMLWYSRSSDHQFFIDLRSDQTCNFGAESVSIHSSFALARCVLA